MFSAQNLKEYLPSLEKYLRHQAALLAFLMMATFAISKIYVSRHPEKASMQISVYVLTCASPIFK